MAEDEQSSSTPSPRPKGKAPKLLEVLRRRLEAGGVPVLTAHFPTVTILKRRGRPRLLSKEDENAARAELKRYLGEGSAGVSEQPTCPDATPDQAISYIQGWLETSKQVSVGTSTVRDRIVAPIFHERENTKIQP
jgi:hypothetical protein